MVNKLRILIVTMLLCISSVALINNDLNVKASGGDKDIKLDYQFVYREL